jgi:ankyrin repeat protein
MKPKAILVVLISFAACVWPDETADQLVEAAYLGDFHAVRTLTEQGADVNATDSGGKTPVYFAALSGHVDIYEYLIAHGAHFDLLVCSAAGDLERASEMIERGSDVKAADEHGSTALMAASSDRCVEVMALLLDSGAYIDSQNNQGRTALMLAARDGQRKAVELLLRRNADVRIKDKSGKSALDLAERHRVVDRAVADEIIGMLVKSGTAKQR